MKRWWDCKIADHALSIEKDGRQRQIVERLIKKTQDGTLGTPTDDPFPSEPMAVTVGDKFEYNIPPAQPIVQQVREKGILEKLALMGVAATGFGGTAALLSSVLPGRTEQPPPVVAPEQPGPTDTDTDTVNRLELRLE